MSALIPDPAEPHKRAIDPATGRLAHGVFLGPARNPGDPLPTAAELEVMVTPERHIGYTTDPFGRRPQEGR